MRSGVPCCCWHIHVCSNLRQVTSPLDVHSLCLPPSDVACMCQKAAGWRLVERLNSFWGRCLARMCFPVIWQLAVTKLASQSACCHREHVRRFGGPTAPSPASGAKELRSATGIVSADGREESIEGLLWDIPMAVLCSYF